MATLVTTNTTFNLAHWVFAFSYLALSYRLQLIAKGLPENTYNCHLNTANFLVCLLNVAIPAIVWICLDMEDFRDETIAYYIE